MKSLNHSLRLALSALSLTLCLQNTAEAKGGVGTRNGGQYVVDIDGIPHLRDIHDKCEWSPLRPFFAAVPHANPMLQALKRSHWILGNAMDREIDRLEICLTGTLRSVPLTEQDKTVTFYRTKRAVQGAVRVNDGIYLDHALFRALPEEEQAATMFHEIMHSFIPFETSAENDPRHFLVQTATYAILSNYRAPLPQENWAITIRRTEMTIPPYTRELDAYRGEVDMILDPRSPKNYRYDAMEKVGLERLQTNLFWKDYFPAEDELVADYLKAYEALQLDMPETLQSLLIQGVKPEFAVIPMGDTRATLLELAPAGASEDSMHILLRTMISVRSPSPERVRAMEKLAVSVMNGKYETLLIDRLIYLGLPASSGLRIVLDAPTNTDREQIRLKTSIQAFITAGVDLNQAWIPGETKKEPAQTPFSYAVTRNPFVAAYILALPSSRMEVVETSALKESEKARLDFVQVLARLNHLEAIRKVLGTFPINAFNRMTLVGFMKAEKRNEAAQIIETTFPKGSN